MVSPCGFHGHPSTAKLLQSIRRLSVRCAAALVKKTEAFDRLIAHVRLWMGASDHCDGESDTFVVLDQFADELWILQAACLAALGEHFGLVCGPCVW